MIDTDELDEPPERNTICNVRETLCVKARLLKVMLEMRTAT